MRLNVPVEEYTTFQPVTGKPDMTMDELQHLMSEHGIRHLPIVDAGQVVGLISDRDVRVVRGLPEAHRLQVRASDVMTADPRKAKASAPLDEVALSMSERKIGSVIVNDADGNLMGLFTVTDALNALIEMARNSKL